MSRLSSQKAEFPAGSRAFDQDRGGDRDQGRYQGGDDNQQAQQHGLLHDVSASSSAVRADAGMGWGRGDSGGGGGSVIGAWGLSSGSVFRVSSGPLRGWMPGARDRLCLTPRTYAIGSQLAQRWAIARRLVTDDTMPVCERVAGALVVLYAQPLARIVALTTEHVHIDGRAVALRLGDDQLELPEPFASLITQLPAPTWDSPASHLPTRWLFPSTRAGQHMRPVALGARLRTLGIDPRPMRLSALHQLAADLPPAILASTLGIRPTTAVRWPPQI